VIIVAEVTQTNHHVLIVLLILMYMISIVYSVLDMTVQLDRPAHQDLVGLQDQPDYKDPSVHRDP